jgi:hypothetical protein
MPEATRTVQITLNPQSVIAPAAVAIRDAQEVVSLALNAVAGADLTNAPEPPTVRAALRLENAKRDPEERRATYSNWLISRGLHDVAGGVRRSLEAAHLYIQIIRHVASLERKSTTMGDLQGSLFRIRSKANKANFPQLMEWVNEGLVEPLSFEKEFSSLQKARNCLEHRGGIVAAKIDADEGSGVLVLSFPRLKLFYEKGGAEIEIHKGHIVEPDGDHAVIKAKRVINERSFNVGDRIQISAEDFFEIGLGCWLFAQDLVGKLPKPAPPAAT